jgi:acyl-CoA thioester hydrolase
MTSAALSKLGGEPERVPAHEFPVRVYYEDTDAAGLVYYANYLKFAERARTEMLRQHGTDHATMLKSTGLGFVVRRCEIDYIKPARLDDLLRVTTRVAAVGGATLDLDQDVLRGRDTLVRMHVGLALLNAAGRPARLPATLRAALESICQNQE